MKKKVENILHPTISLITDVVLCVIVFANTEEWWLRSLFVVLISIFWVYSIFIYKPAYDKKYPNGQKIEPIEWVVFALWILVSCAVIAVFGFNPLTPIIIITVMIFIAAFILSGPRIM